jgi:hypothetical protein
MAAPEGNQNAKNARMWRDAILRETAKRGGNLSDGLAKAAVKLCDAVEAGESWAIKEYGDRVDGKPAQAVELDGRLEVSRLVIND